MTREELKEKLQNLGARVSSSVSVKTDYVIVGSKPGSKYQKAQNLGIKILKESEILEILS